MILDLPLPHPFHELLAPEFLAGDLLGAQQVLFHLQLGGDAGMVAARHPQRRDALHTVVADHQVLHRHEHNMPQVQFTGHVGRRDGDDERLFGRVKTGLVRVIGGLEIAAFLPHLVDARLSGLEIIGFG